MERWNHGDLIVKRERLGLQPAQVATPQPAAGIWFGLPVYVVEDTADQLVTYIAPGAEFGFAAGDWPTEDGKHPYHGRGSWDGAGCLMVQRTVDHHAIWHFWNDDRELSVWYVNLQTAFERTPVGFDTQDLDLDIIVFPDSSHLLKDDEVMEQRIHEGRYSAELVDWVRAYGARFTERLDREGVFWDQAWADWEPPEQWRNPRLPTGWEH